MKFQRINEDTIRCIVYKQDMQEYGIALEDFFKDKRKIHDFLHEVVERAEREIGYTPKEGMLSMQIIPLNPNMISITFSENVGDSYDNIMNNIKNTFENSMGYDEEDEIDYIDEYDDEGQDYDINDDNEYNEKRNYLSDVSVAKPQVVMIAMQSIERLADFCRILGIVKTVTSELYYLKSKDVYCLIIEKNRLTEQDMRHILVLAVEYTSDIVDDQKVICYVREHGETIIDKSAYRILKQYV
ncbi:MAG: adaptor protein MecA [Lachnospiraceae bacterium]|nr:adaptor protein MecA [Lachnospiraceae bacterium]